jgi:replicative DNA helicase
MNAVTELDLRAGGGQPNLPANLDAELALMGVVLYDNEAAHRCEGLKPEHFFEPLHGRLWAIIAEIISRPGLAEPIIVADRMQADPAFAALGGLGFLAEMVDRAPPSNAAGDLAKLIMDTAQRRELLALGGNLAQWARDPEAPIADVQQAVEDALLGMGRVQARARVVSAAEAAADVLAYLDAPEATGGVLTGLEALDNRLGTLQGGDLILIAGRPGMGKSALGACIALNAAKAGVGTIEINSEMTTAQMMRRHLTDLCFDRHGKASPFYKDIRRREISPAQRRMLEQAAKDISAMPLAMVKRTGLTLSSARSLIRRQRAAWAQQGIKLGLVTIDHVGLLSADGGGRDRYSDQTAIAIGSKQLADDLGIPVIALVQLNRQVEQRDNKRPTLADLRDSGAWEENADTVIGVYREAYYANKDPEPKSGSAGSAADLKWQEWDSKRKSRAIDAMLLKVREGEEGVATLWASIGHNAIRTSEPDDKGGQF